MPMPASCRCWLRADASLVPMPASCRCRLRADDGFMPMLASCECRPRADSSFMPMPALCRVVYHRRVPLMVGPPFQRLLTELPGAQMLWRLVAPTRRSPVFRFPCSAFSRSCAWRSLVEGVSRLRVAFHHSPSTTLSSKIGLQAQTSNILYVCIYAACIFNYVLISPLLVLMGIESILNPVCCSPY